MFEYQRLIKIRLELGFSALRFAESIGVPIATYNRIEKGTGKLDVDAAGKLVELYNVNPSWLFFGQGEMFSAPTVKVEKDQYDQLLKENYQMAQELAELRKKEIEALKAENIKLKSQAERLKNNP